MQQQVGSISENRLLAGSYYRLTVHMPSAEPWVTARPGQFVHVGVPDRGDLILRRPFSIFDAEENQLQILYKVKGRGTFALSRLRPGASLDLIGPLGTGFPGRAGSHPLLVAGGYGIAPLYRLAREYGNRCTVIYGGRTAADLVCQADLATTGCRLLAVTEDGSSGIRGTTISALQQFLAEQDTRPSSILACGPKAMLRLVSEICTRRDLPGWISLEEHMACGVGACLGCVVRVRQEGLEKWACACTEGPVFSVNEIVWGRHDDPE